ncbi:MAG TPA: MEDS domain-containing protein [Verrucomicrobiae bacterium]|nr:MEDS domain-containing protein [Verrucomicrobiae bacterium]
MTRTINVAGRQLGVVRHICAFFHSKEEEYRTLMGFIREGVERKEKAFHIVDADQRDKHRTRLQAEGIEVDSAENSGQLRVACWEDAYLKDGYFDQNRQIRLIETVLQEGKREGFPLTRLVANMEWALEDNAGVEDIVEYESRLNYVLPKYEDPVICTYDLSRFNAGVAMDILRTHPLVIIGGALQENPLYVPPDEFLKELEDRRTLSG